MNVEEVIKTLRAPPITGWTKKLIWNSFFSSLIGMFIGVTCSLIITVTMVEIAVSKYSAYYFGVLFILTGGILAWRILGAPLPDLQARGRQNCYLALAGLICTSGFLCLFIKPSWWVKTPKILRVLIFTIFGISIAFAIMFSAIDLINIGYGLFTMSSTRSPVESNSQVTLIVLITLIMGSIFGFIFGFLDVENEVNYHIKLSLLKKEGINYPIAALLGGITGFANEYLRNQEEGYVQMKRAEYDTRI